MDFMDSAHLSLCIDYVCVAAGWGVGGSVVLTIVQRVGALSARSTIAGKTTSNRCCASQWSRHYMRETTDKKGEGLTDRIWGNSSLSTIWYIFITCLVVSGWYQRRTEHLVTVILHVSVRVLPCNYPVAKVGGVMGQVVWSFIKAKRKS